MRSLFSQFATVYDKEKKQLLRKFNHMPYTKSTHEVKLSTFKNEVTQDPGC